MLTGRSGRVGSGASEVDRLGDQHPVPVAATAVALLVQPDGIAVSDDDLKGLTYFYVAVLAVLVAVDVALAFAIRAGRRWAWIVRLVLAGIGLPGAVSQLLSPDRGGPAVDEVLNVVSAVVAVAVLVLLLVRPTRHFVGVGGPRRPG